MSTLDIEYVSRAEHNVMLGVAATLLEGQKRDLRFRTWLYLAALAFLAILVLYASHRAHPVTLAVPMPGYDLPVCATEDSTPVGGCVWPSEDAVWINYPGRT